MAAEPLASIRIDKWLWAARFFKTRSLAQEAVELGRVRLAGQRLKPSRDVKPGDRLTVERGEERFEIFVEKISGEITPTGGLPQYDQPLSPLIGGCKSEKRQEMNYS